MMGCFIQVVVDITKNDDYSIKTIAQCLPLLSAAWKVLKLVLSRARYKKNGKKSFRGLPKKRETYIGSVDENFCLAVSLLFCLSNKVCTVKAR